MATRCRQIFVEGVERNRKELGLHWKERGKGEKQTETPGKRMWPLVPGLRASRIPDFRIAGHFLHSLTVSAYFIHSLSLVLWHATPAGYFIEMEQVNSREAAVVKAQGKEGPGNSIPDSSSSFASQIHRVCDLWSMHS